MRARRCSEKFNVPSKASQSSYLLKNNNQPSTRLHQCSRQAIDKQGMLQCSREAIEKQRPQTFSPGMFGQWLDWVSVSICLYHININSLNSLILYFAYCIICIFSCLIKLLWNAKHIQTLRIRHVLWILAIVALPTSTSIRDTQTFEYGDSDIKVTTTTATTVIGSYHQ